MNTDKTDKAGGIVYPGCYVPAVPVGELAGIADTDSRETTLPRANITEIHNGYKVELEAPGMEKEQFVIQTDKNILTIAAVNTTEVLPADAHYCLHEFGSHSFLRNIALPPDANTTFIHAAYHAGILTIHLCKTKGEQDHTKNSIPVY
ncbi:Hsp20/alpha crystallin family protein [Niabella beijingensis]|uniref:Hsp20/alpha crystallin family protein n=1 Tax=Niabella beijingensis TaxID=2872700 RepID=UPI001CBDA692|nr:Hsp20/alpha crystallin family protein [Niabella beijingensis]MBZ4191318.1 Hsp20/alpha crystallin family protein [Niabella beijingensis]